MTSNPNRAPRNIRKGLSAVGATIALSGMFGSAVESGASAASKGSTKATIERVVSGGASELLPDVNNTYKPGTIMYKSPSTAKGKNIYGHVGAGEELLIDGVIAVQNPESGDSMLWQPTSIYGTGEVVWVVYGGEKTFAGSPILKREISADNSYHPRMTFADGQFIAVYDQAHASTIDNAGQINGSNRVVVGQGSLVQPG